MNIEQKLGIKVFYYYLSRRVLVAILLFLVSFVIFSFNEVIVSKIVFLFPVSVAVAIVDYFIGGLFVISILALAAGFLLSWLQYISCTFALEENSFNIRRGIFSKKEVSIPYRQVQDVDIDQTFFNKLMGVSKLVILTAGNDDNDEEGEAEGIFEVIDADVAEKLREDILRRTNVQTVKEIKN
jgi:putative membrane protein